jgi:hypothetical protein
MAEAMTVELIIDAYWALKGYWTHPRFSFQTKKGGWSDFDVIAYHPSDKVLVVSESKIQGRATDVFAFNQCTRRYIKRKDGSSSFAEWESGPKGYLNFISNIHHIWEDKLIFDSTKTFRKSVSKFIIQLVSNYIMTPELLPECKKSVRDLFFESTSRFPLKKEAIDINLTTPFNLFCEIQSVIIEKPQGRRYGNPILDLARELNRFLFPRVQYGGRGASAMCKNFSHKVLTETFGLK